MFKRTLLGVALFFCATTSFAQSFFLDATNPSNAVSFSLLAGDYEVDYVSGAWNAWGSTSSGCDAPNHCTGTGWLNAFLVTTASGSTTYADGFVWASSALAEASAIANLSPINLHLLSDQTVTFYIPDFPYGDNTGGIALSLSAVTVTPVPEPETYAMLLAGLGLLGFAARRRKMKQAA